MEKEKINSVKAKENEETIDLLHLLSVLWRKAWLIVLAGILLAGACFGWATFMIPETYSSSVMLYVNTETSLAGYSISLSDLNTAKSLVSTYMVILKSRETLLMVLDEAESDRSYQGLSGMITASQVNGTEIFSITVTSTDPEEAARLANAIAVVLPLRVEAIINGASMRLVSGAVVNSAKVGPNITRYTALGLFAGMLLAAIVIIVLDLLNDVIRDEEHILQTYDIPILARVPDMLGKEFEHGYYSYGYGDSGKG